MNDTQTTIAAALTVLTLLALVARVILGLRPDQPAPRWLTLGCVVLVAGFIAAMAARLSTAL
jgi:hypothetical protein